MFQMAKTGIRGVFARMNPAAANGFAREVLIGREIVVQK